eukprot:jgi/Astpho2/4565/Aster-00147
MSAPVREVADAHRGSKKQRTLSVTGYGSAKDLHLRPCKHQVAGHLFEEGKAGSLVDEQGHFYKPVQNGPRGRREREFYELVSRLVALDRTAALDSQQGHQDFGQDCTEEAEETSSSGRSDEESLAAHAGNADMPFTVRNAVMLSSIPGFYGTVEIDGPLLLELEDVAKRYRHPSIIDIKVGFRTWYNGADQRYIEKCKLKDASTTQAALGFKICGMQVYRACQRGYWRASKRWCKQLPQDAVDKALCRFANNESGLCPQDVYGGKGGAIAQLCQLEKWFQRQREFFFYSSSVLIIYEGDAETPEDARVIVRLVDFAHTFPSEGQKDGNFLAGLRTLIARLTGVMALECQDAGTLIF